MYIFVPVLSSGKLAKHGDSAANFPSAVGDLREVARAACVKWRGQRVANLHQYAV